MSDKLGRTYVPKVGDIVNVTLRDAHVVAVNDVKWGELGFSVKVVGSDNGEEREFYVTTFPGGGATDIELVKAAEPPKPKWPTTPGSIIGHKSVISKYVLLVNGKWQSLHYGDLWDEDAFNKGSYEVLFDAGAPR